MAIQYLKSSDTPFTHHLHESFKVFMEQNIVQVLNHFNPIVIEKDINDKKEHVKMTIWVENPTISPPTEIQLGTYSELSYIPLTPTMCRQRNISYTGTLSANIKYVIHHTSKDDTINQYINGDDDNTVDLGNIPLMIGPDEYDEGGIFIIRGVNKVMICNESLYPNKIHLFKNSKGVVEACIRTHDDLEVNNFLVHVFKDARGCYMVRMTQFAKPILFTVLIKALDPTMTDKDIVDLTDPDPRYNSLQNTFEEMAQISNYHDLIRSGYSTKLDLTPIQFLESHLFPHIHATEHRAKCIVLLRAVRLLICNEHKIIDIDDRDDFANKRIRTVSDYLTQIFFNSYVKMIDNMTEQIKKNIQTKNININPSCHIVDKFESMFSSIATGNFQLRSNNIGESSSSLTQTYAPQNWFWGLSNKRRIKTPSTRSNSKIINPRRLHGAHFGYICPLETPEGKEIGFVKNMAFTTRITTALPFKPIVEMVKSIAHILPLDKGGMRSILVQVNCEPIGWVDEQYALSVFYTLKQMKQTGVIGIFSGIVFNVATLVIDVYIDKGRLTRPLVKLDRGNIPTTFNKKLYTWQDYVYNGLVEFIDIHESAGDHVMVAFDPTDVMNRKHIKFTHMEIDPSFMFGVCVGSIIFSNRNQSPRNSYESAMIKQTISLPYWNGSRGVFDTISHELLYHQRPILTTPIFNVINAPPFGNICRVAIMTYTGFNMEDSVIFNADSIRRGLFADLYTRTFSAEIQRTNVKNPEFFANPLDYPDCHDIRYGGDVDIYRHLNPLGLPRIGSVIHQGDILIGKITPKTIEQEDGCRVSVLVDTSIQYKLSYPCEIIDIINTDNGDGYNLIKVKVGLIRLPVVGDKFASCHAQKGVVSTVLPGALMPVDVQTGLSPDIIINPHGMPSRMTIGQLWEMVLTAYALENGLTYEIPVFSNVGKMEVNKYAAQANRKMRSGFTGRILDETVFMTPVYYQRLKHTVNDKFHARAIGRLGKYTRQPAEGRQKDGGLRLGIMELDCFNAHGMSLSSYEKKGPCSDEHIIYVCARCHQPAIVNDFSNKLDRMRIGVHPSEPPIYYCTCKDNFNRDRIDEFYRVRIPFMALQVMRKLKTVGIDMRLMT